MEIREATVEDVPAIYSCCVEVFKNRSNVYFRKYNVKRRF